MEDTLTKPELVQRWLDQPAGQEETSLELLIGALEAIIPEDFLAGAGLAWELKSIREDSQGVAPRRRLHRALDFMFMLEEDEPELFPEDEEWLNLVRQVRQKLTANFWERHG